MISAQRSTELRIGEAGETRLLKYAHRAPGNWTGLLGRLICHLVCVRTLLACLLIVWFASDTPAQVLTGSCKVQGTLKYETYDDAGTPQVKATRAFSIVINPQGWLAHIDIPREEGLPWLFFEVFPQEDAVCTLGALDSSRIRTGTNSTKGLLVTNQLSVIPGSIPFGGDSFVTPLWFAFASQDSVADGRVKRFYTFSRSEFDLKNYLVQMTTDDRSGGISSRVTFSNEGRVVIPLKDHESITKTPLPPYDHGFVDAVYQVHEFFRDPVLPKRFSFVFFRGVVGATNRSQVMPAAAYVVEAVSIEKGPSENPVASVETLAPRKPTDQEKGSDISPAPGRFAHQFKGLAAVYDSRALNIKGAPTSYVSTNGPVPKQDLQRTVAIQNTMLHASRRLYTRILVLVVFGLGILAPLFFWARFRTK